MHCSSSSHITCSIKTWTALTARRRKCWRNSSCSGMTGDDDSDVEPSGDHVVGLCLDTGITPSFVKNGKIVLKELSMPVVSSQITLLEKPRLYTTLGMVPVLQPDPLVCSQFSRV